MLALCGAGLLLALWLMVGTNYHARANQYAARAAQLSDAGARGEAAGYVAQALAINPYRPSLWAQLGYLAPPHRQRAAQFSQSLTRGALFNRLHAADQLGVADE